MPLSVAIVFSDESRAVGISSLRTTRERDMLPRSAATVLSNELIAVDMSLHRI